MDWFNNIADRAAKQLVTHANELDDISHQECHSWEMRFLELKPPRLEELNEQIGETLDKDCLSIYTFHLTDESSLEILRSAINIARKQNIESRAYARVNQIGVIEQNRCLYVGTSRKTPQRLKEHLGLGNIKTYSLQLSHWATKLGSGFRIDVFSFENTAKNRKLLPLLEDQLACDRGPILGRRGMR
jgi:hypothetical protein